MVGPALSVRLLEPLVLGRAVSRIELAAADTQGHRVGDL